MAGFPCEEKARGQAWAGVSDRDDWGRDAAL